MKSLFWIALFSLCLGSFPALAALEPGFREPDPDLLQEIHELFPEGQEISPLLLDYRINPNLKLFREARIEVTFIWEGAGFQNSFGYFLYRDLNEDGEISEAEITGRQTLWENASQLGGGGDLRSGDSLSLGKFPAGTRMGFFLEANGHRDAEAIYYTLDAFNPDGHRHLAMMATADREEIVLGIEDLPWNGSDRDFNDLMFTVSADPKSALQEAIEAGNIPVHASPSPTPVPRIQGFPDKIVEVGPTVAATPAAPPLLLEGAGCRLTATGQETLARYEWSLQGAGLIYLWARRRNSKKLK